MTPYFCIVFYASYSRLIKLISTLFRSSNTILFYTYTCVHCKFSTFYFASEYATPRHGSWTGVELLRQPASFTTAYDMMTIRCFLMAYFRNFYELKSPLFLVLQTSDLVVCIFRADVVSEGLGCQHAV